MPNYDYASILARLYQNLSTKEQHQNIFENSAYASLLESLAQELEFYYLSDGYLTRENQWSLARNKSSLLSQSAVHGYIAPRKIGASGVVKFGISEDYDTTPSTNINIPKYTQLSNGGTIVVTVDDNYQLTTTDTSVNLGVVQGTARSETFTATGSDYEEFIIYNNSIENSFVDIYVNGITYTKVDSMFDADALEAVCEVTNLVDFSGIKLKFGNDTFGRALSNGDTILVRYVETLGVDGNIYQSDIINTVSSTIYDVGGTVVETVYCTNDTALSGGADEVTLEEIRSQSPKIYQTGDRAVSKDDYISILEGISYIKKVNAWGAYEYNIDQGLDPWAYVSTEENKVHVALITENDENVSEAQQEDILETINPNKSPTDILSFETVSFINLIFDVEAYVINSSYSLSDVRQDIEDGLSEEYSLDNLDFEENIYYSDYIRFIDSITGVKYHNTTVRAYMLDTFDSAYAITSFQIPMYPLDPEYFKVYAKLSTDEDYTLIATMNEEGAFVPESGYVLTGSVLNTLTGEGNLVVSSGLSGDYSDYTIRFEYKTLNDNLLLNNRADIFRYAESNVTTQYFQNQ